MSALAELQLKMKQALIEKKEDVLDDYIVSAGLSPQQRLAIYRNNFYITGKNILTAIYPAVQAMVGELFFSALTHQYMTHYPAKHRNISQIGENFPKFLAEMESLHRLPYLSELALFEWAIQELTDVAKGPEIDLKMFENLQDNSGCQLNPASKLMKFKFPILPIFQLYQKKIENVDLTQGAQYVLLLRQQWDFIFLPLSETEFVFLSALDEGRTITDACDAVWQIDSQADISFYLQNNLFRGTIVGVKLNKE